jgi:hypothetical protein
MSTSDDVFASAIDVIGETPLVELSRLTRDLDGCILAKLEYLNPGFSKKDRIARQMIEDAETQGKIEARPDRGGAHEGEHGNGSGHCLCRQGLSLRSRHVEGELDGTRPDDVGAWC